MGNSNSRYEQNMLSNLPPGYIPTYPAVPPYALKKKGWNPFGKSRKKREEELKQYFYTTPFVWMYPPGSSYPIPNPIGPDANRGVTAGQMPIPGPTGPVIPDSRRYRRRSYDSYDDSLTDREHDRDRRYRRQPRRPSYDSAGAYSANPLPLPPRNVLAETPHRRVLSLLPSGGSRHRDYRREHRSYEPHDYEPRHRRRHTTDYYRSRDDRDRDEPDADRDRRRREREREREREEREREREEREEEELEREEEREELEEEREERREELDERRRLRRTRGMGFDTLATGISNMLNRGPSMRMPEPDTAHYPMRGPTPAPMMQGSTSMPPAGAGGVGGFVPSAVSSAGPPPPPPMAMTSPYPYGGPAVGMPTPNPVTPGVMPSAVMPQATMMPTPNMNGMPMLGGGGGPVIPGQSVPMPSSPYFPQPFAGGGPGLPGTREPMLIGDPLQISEYMYPGIPAASDGGGPFYYKGEQYPTSLHLFEALKFMPHREDIARQIRSIQDRTDMIQFSERNAAARRTDWDQVALSMMDEALLAKFRYHEHLRNTLLETGQRPLEFSDPVDTFWGATYDGTGQNHMGHSLERVRQVLHEEFHR